MRVFDWALRLNGFPIHEASKKLQSVLELDREHLLAWQQNQAWELYHWHLQGNEVYKDHILKHLGSAEAPKHWHELPLVKKSDLQQPFETLITKPYRRADCFVNNTSGSSGTPFFFAKDKWCHAMSWANTKRLFGAHGIDFNSSLQARFYGIPLSGMKFRKEQIKDYLSHRVRFPVFNLDDVQCARYLDVFRHKPFEYLNGYTSSLVLFADFVQRQGMVLKQICPTLKACFTTSEMCSAEDRVLLENAFGIHVVNEYGASELELIAFEDVDGAWIINEENLWVEVVDIHGNPVADGEEGEIVVTSLYNKAFPMIRYALGDRGIITSNVIKGHSRVLQQLTGRTNDVAILPSGKKVPGLTFYYVTKALMHEQGALKEVVIRQTAPAVFECEYAREKPLSQQEEEEVIRLFQTYLEPGLDVHFHQVSHVTRTASGKLKQFSRTF